jgi:hypothetical protein
MAMSINNDLQSAIAALRAVHAKRLEEAANIEAAIRQLEAQTEGAPVWTPGEVVPTTTLSRAYESLGPLDAAVRLYQELGRPLTTRELADGLLARGVKTSSRNFTASIYATLTNSKQWKRNEQGQWAPIVP